MDLGKLMGMFGFDADDARKLTEDPQIQNMMQNPEVQAIMQNPNLTDIFSQASQLVAQGGIMPDDVERMTENLSGMDGLMSQMSDLFGGMGFEEMDLDEEAAAYEPETVDAGDRAFVIELKAWLKDVLTDIPATDVCMLEIGFHDNVSDANWIKNNLPAIARAVAGGILQYFGLPLVQPQQPQSARGSLTSGTLNIRARPDTNSRILASAPNGSPITVLGVTGNWYVVRYGSVTGYAVSRFINLV